MGQFWSILNIDAKQVDPVCPEELGKFFFEDLTGLYNALCLPILPKEIDVWLKHGEKVRQPGPFGKLPVELINQIYDELSDETTHVTVSLAITCKHLLEVGKRHILRSLRKYHAPWAGGRTICWGTDTDDDTELPKGMLSDAELKELHEAVPPCLPGETTNFVTLAFETYEQPGPSVTRCATTGACRAASGEVILKGRLRGEHHDTPLERLELEMFEVLCCMGLAQYPPKGSMVLCNITKGEYVRQDGISKMPLASGRRRYEVGLAHALVSRICWSTDDSVSMVCDKARLEKLVKGPWAGDRFVITTLDAMPSPGSGKKWKNVSVEVNGFLRYLWENNKHRKTRQESVFFYD